MGRIERTDSYALMLAGRKRPTLQLAVAANPDVGIIGPLDSGLLLYRNMRNGHHHFLSNSRQ